jgi:hypothetical protein
MMAAIYAAAVALTLAQGEGPGPGRGDNPSDTGGALIIVGAIIFAILIVGTGCYLVARGTARRRGEGKRSPGHE